MRYLSVCSGIEAATVAWHPLGFSPVAFAEIDKFPAAVLAHHYPAVPNYGDLTKFQEWPDAAIDVLVGGTPCQSFSVAGLRAGLADPRGNLALVYLALADRYRPEWVVWENVPGVLSSGRGRDFGAFLGGLAALGYGFAYRVLDAQYFGLAQRRQRVFVVGHLGDWRRAAAVLFERESLSGHPAPRREAGKGVADFAISRALTSSHTATRRLDPNETTFLPVLAPTIPSRRSAGGGLGTDFDCDGELIPTPYTLAIRGRGDSHDLKYRQDGTANAILTPNGGRGGIGVGAVAFAHQAGGNHTSSGAFSDEMSPTLQKAQTMAVQRGMQVRRLTPRECERLQGFLDDYTLIPYRGKPAADGPRYKALGNSMAVPCMRWIGKRIAAVAAL